MKQHAGPRTVLGSGDLFTAQDCLDMFAQTGVDGVSVARGAIGNPWIFAAGPGVGRGRGAAAAEPAPAARGDRRALSAGRRDLRARAAVAGQCASSASSTPGCIRRRRQVRDAFVAVTQPSHWRAVLDRWYAEDLPGVQPAAPVEGYYAQS